MTDLAGTQVGMYTIDRLVEMIGPIEIYEAHYVKRTLQLEVYDVLAPEDAGNVLRGAQVAAKLPFDRVVGLLDVGVAPDGRPYLVRERLAGVLLSSLAPCEPARARAITRNLVECVAVAHDLGIAIGDLRSERVFVENTPVGGRVRLWDLRYARRTENPSADTRADLTACVAILYELITGARVGSYTDPDDAPVFASLFRRAFAGRSFFNQQGGFARPEELLAVLATDDGTTPAELPVARLLPKKK